MYHCLVNWLYNLLIFAFRPLRTREEEHSFIYGDILEEACDISDYDQKTSKWTPRELNKDAVSKLLQHRVDDMLKVSGPNNDAVRRIKQLEKQFPLHDVEPEKCHQLSPGEIDRWDIETSLSIMKRNIFSFLYRMSSYVDNVKRNIAGQGRVGQLRDEDQDPAPVMPPPMKLLPIVTHGASAGKYDQRPASACWACAGCGGRMEPGEVAVFAERAGADKCWHPDCFSCCECGEILEVTRHLTFKRSSLSVSGPSLLLQSRPALLRPPLCSQDGHPQVRRL